MDKTPNASAVCPKANEPNAQGFRLNFESEGFQMAQCKSLQLYLTKDFGGGQNYLEN